MRDLAWLIAGVGLGYVLRISVARISRWRSRRRHLLSNAYFGGKVEHFPRPPSTTYYDINSAYPKERK